MGACKIAEAVKDERNADWNYAILPRDVFYDYSIFWHAISWPFLLRVTPLAVVFLIRSA